MIENKYLFPQCYIQKIPKCDDCKEVLFDTNIMYPTNPPKWKYTCPKCGKEYAFFEKDLRGEWKFRTI